MLFSEKYEKPFKGKTSKEQHILTYKAAIEDLGFEDLVYCLPYTLDVLQKKYKNDKHFNNTSLKVWQSAAGFTATKDSYVPMYCSLLRDMLLKKGVNAYSCAQGVCLLKAVARRLVEEYEKMLIER